ncbi:MAG TPA: NAD(+)/NADH kinase [Candidatus Paceibacterota bacterium]
MIRQGTTVGFVYRPENKPALYWANKISLWLNKKHPEIKVVEKRAKILLVLGGDGTILEAARQHQSHGPTILGLNLGQVGFLASIRDEKNFIPGLDKFFKGNFSVIQRMMLKGDVVRNGKIVFTTNALNEVAVQNLLGIVELGISIDRDPVQTIRGTGALVSTATGSTAYNLSAHGPIVMPDIECFIVTELMDHNIPSPSIVVKRNKNIHLKVVSFRERGLLSVSRTGEKADVMLITDGSNIFPLKEKDVVTISRSSKLIKFIELEKNYFFKSLQEKFSFK